MFHSETDRRTIRRHQAPISSDTVRRRLRARDPRRFIDDIFCIWCGGQDSVDEFINYINSFHATIKFTANYSPNSVNFLNVTINKSPPPAAFRGQRGISTDVYCKPTDTHQYLLSDSCHPKHCKEAIAYSQALRIRRICSTDTLYMKRSSELRQHLVSVGHSKCMVQLAINRALCTSRSTLLATRVNKKTLPNRVPMVTTYHPRLPRLSSIINDNMTILHSSGRLRSAIPEPPLVAPITSVI